MNHNQEKLIFQKKAYDLAIEKKRCLEKVVEMTENGILDPKEGGVFNINDIGKAHAFLENRSSVGKIAVNW